MKYIQFSKPSTPPCTQGYHNQNLRYSLQYVLELYFPQSSAHVRAYPKPSGASKNASHRHHPSSPSLPGLESLLAYPDPGNHLHPKVFR
jgi:hypothetical protein